MRRSTATEIDYLKLLLYGLPGSTKTRTACTAALDPRTSPVLLLNAAGNPVSLTDFAKVPDVLSLDNLSDLNDPFEWLQGGQPVSGWSKQYGLNPPYRTVILDSITEIQRMSFRAQSAWVGPGSFPAKVERQHFYNTLGQMVNMANLFFSLPMNVIMTALEEDKKDEQTGTIHYGPLLWGQSDKEVGAYAYIVARMVHRAALTDQVAKKLLTETEDPINKEVVSVALFTPSGKYQAKDQTGKLGDFMVNPTITKMLDAIGGIALAGETTTKT